MCKEVETAKEEYEFTHKVIMTVYSKGSLEEVRVKVEWDPDLEGADIKNLGYLPASYEFMQEYILPAINEAKFQWEFGPFLMSSSPSEYKN